MLSYNLSQLDRITKKIASKIKSNDYIMLYGELGSGKTTFARSFINGLQKKNKVKETNVLSPTFNLLYEYDVKSWKIMHFDLYRLQNTKEIDELNVLEGSKQTISKKVKFILIEKQFFQMYKNYSYNKIEEVLRQNNFRLIKRFNYPLLNFQDNLYIKKN